MEFVFLIGLAFTVMIVFIASTRSEFDDLSKEKERSLVKDVSLKVQQELIIASTVEDGYLRSFLIPADLDAKYYQINIINNTLLVNTEDYEYVLSIPATTGNPNKGINTINKTGGIIYIN
jgi:hypothetical protein